MTKKFKKRIEEKEAGQYIGKTNCPSCGSTDNLAVYKHEDDSYSSTCFGGACSFTSPNWDYEGNQSLSTYRESTPEELAYEKQQREIEEKFLMALPSLEEVRDVFESDSLKDRKISKTAMKAYGVRTDINDKGKVYREFYPTYRAGKHVGYRIRSEFTKEDREVTKKPELLGVRKNFKGRIGDTKKGVEMFGQHLFKPSEFDVLHITEGEIDAMTGWDASRRSTKNKMPYAFVSMPSGANIEGLKTNLEYISSFKTIRLCFDKDDAGNELLEKALKVLPVGKVEIITFPNKVKDLNEEWQNNMSEGAREALAKKIYHCVWKGEKYSPAGIKTFSEGWTDYINKGDEILIPYPDSFGDLNEKTYGGYGLGEITNIAAASSVGKSSFVKEMILTALEKTSYKIGILSFEETQPEFTEGLMSVEMGVQLNEIPLDMRDRDAEKKSFDRIVSMGTTEGSDTEMDRIKFVDHQGACDGTELMEKIAFLIDGLDCKMIILDPVTLALSGQDTSEDDFASDLVKIVKRKNVAWLNIHHVRKSSTGTKANSEGADLTEEDIKGSGVWFQTAMNNIMLMRNKDHEHPVVRNTTKLKLTKCRRHGKNTGLAGYTYYNGETGRLEYGCSPEEILEGEERDDELEFDDKPVNGFE